MRALLYSMCRKWSRIELLHIVKIAAGCVVALHGGRRVRRKFLHFCTRALSHNRCMVCNNKKGKNSNNFLLYIIQQKESVWKNLKHVSMSVLYNFISIPRTKASQKLGKSCFYFIILQQFNKHSIWETRVGSGCSNYFFPRMIQCFMTALLAHPPKKLLVVGATVRMDGHLPGKLIKNNSNIF